MFVCASYFWIDNEHLVLRRKDVTVATGVPRHRDYVPISPFVVLINDMGPGPGNKVQSHSSTSVSHSFVTSTSQNQVFILDLVLQVLSVNSFHSLQWEFHMQKGDTIGPLLAVRFTVICRWVGAGWLSYFIKPLPVPKIEIGCKSRRPKLCDSYVLMNGCWSLFACTGGPLFHSTLQCTV